MRATTGLAVFETDEGGVVVANVPNASAFYAQGDTAEEARTNLEDVIEGNVLLALQLGWDIPSIPGIHVEEQSVPADPS